MGYGCVSGTCRALSLSTNKYHLYVLSYSPSNATNRWVKDVITVTFDQKIRLAAEAVHLLDKTDGNRPVTFDLSLSPDETTITITPLDIAAPADVEVSFGIGLTDNWGNRCTDRRTYSYPSWITEYPGSVPDTANMAGATMAVDGAGTAYLGWITGPDTCGGDLHVLRHGDSSWGDDSGRLPADPDAKAFASSLAARADAVAVAWAESGCVPAAIRVAKREGAGAWTLVEGPANSSAATVHGTSLALDGNGDPIVAWSEGDDEVHVARYDGLSWTALGGAVGDTSLGGSAPSLALAPGDVPCVAFRQSSTADSGTFAARAYCWDDAGSSWDPLGSGTVTTEPDAFLWMSSRALAFDEAGAPFVGWSRFGYVEVATLEGDAWTTTRLAGATLSLGAPDLVIDPSLGVVAGWAGASDVGGAAHDATGWRLLPKIIDPWDLTSVEGATFAAGPGSGPWGMWVMDGGSTSYLRTVRYNW